MEFLSSLVFLYVIIFFLWTIKADFFFVIFTAVVFLYLIIGFFTKSPLRLFFEIIKFIIENPLGLVLLILPLTSYLLSNVIQNIIHSKEKRKSLNSI